MPFDRTWDSINLFPRLIASDTNLLMNIFLYIQLTLYDKEITLDNFCFINRYRKVAPVSNPLSCKVFLKSFKTVTYY